MFPPDTNLGLPVSAWGFLSVQAFDTATHALIVRDMVRWDEESAERKLGLHNKFLVVSVVWAIHAIANLVSPKGTRHVAWDAQRTFAQERLHQRGTESSTYAGMKRPIRT